MMTGEKWGHPGLEFFLHLEFEPTGDTNFVLVAQAPSEVSWLHG